jgi:alkylresorcinol/alkylpyrone synthase
VARIHSIATGVPAHRLDLPGVRRILLRHLERLGVRPEAYLRILERTQVAHRHTVLGEDVIERELSFNARNDLYIETSLEVGEKVARAAIEQAGLTPEDIDSIISVSCTGYMIPSIDAHLINRMKLRRTIRRTPITELGCVAGAVGLSRAWEQLQAYPDSRILLLSVELPSLTFQPRDARPAQIISSMIFADGVAGVVLSNQAARRPSPRLLASWTYTVPETIEDMGYDLDNDGLHIVLSSQVPDVIRKTLRNEIDTFLSHHGVTRTDMKWCAMHPAGPKVLTSVEQQLGFSSDDLAPSWKIMCEYGNMSSAAVLFVLGEMVENPRARPGDLGLIVAFGPGVSGELVLARWEE